MVKSIKGRLKVWTEKKGGVALVGKRYKTVGDFYKGSFSSVEGSKAILSRREKVVGIKERKEMEADNFFQDFRNEGEISYRSVVGRQGPNNFFNCRFTTGCFEGKVAVGRER